MKPLFQDFEPIEYLQWKKKLQNDLKTADPEELIQQELVPGLLHPAYCDHTTGQNSWVQDYDQCNVNTKNNWQGARAWTIMQAISGPNLNEFALEALGAGAEGLEFLVTDIDWDRALRGVSVSHVHLGLKTKIEYAQDFCQVMSEFPEHQGYVLLDDLMSNLENMVPVLLRQCSGELKLLSIEEQNQKPGSLEELSNLLAKCIFIINRLLDRGLPLATIVKNIQLRVRLGDHYLWEICRIRAIRILFHKMTVIYGLKDYAPGDLPIHALVNTDEHSQQDWQMLRNTTQAMAAILGGSDLLTINHSMANNTDTRSRDSRIARNVGLILREESQLNRVADPVAGAYYLNSLTEKIAKKVWEQLRETEKHGGYLNLKTDSHV